VLNNDYSLGDKKLCKLDKNIKKGPTTKQNPDKRKKNTHKTYLPLASLPLLFCYLLMLVLSRSFSFALESGCSHMYHRAKKI